MLDLLIPVSLRQLRQKYPFFSYSDSPEVDVDDALPELNFGVLDFVLWQVASYNHSFGAHMECDIFCYSPDEGCDLSITHDDWTLYVTTTYHPAHVSVEMDVSLYYSKWVHRSCLPYVLPVGWIAAPVARDQRRHDSFIPNPLRRQCISRLQRQSIDVSDFLHGLHQLFVLTLPHASGSSDDDGLFLPPGVSKQSRKR